jgi:hypothetical protein
MVNGEATWLLVLPIPAATLPRSPERPAAQGRLSSAATAVQIPSSRSLPPRTSPDGPARASCLPLAA